MKVRMKDGTIEQVKIIQCPDDNCEVKVIKFLDGSIVHSAEFLLRHGEIVEIEREEMKVFNEYLDDTKQMIVECWDYWMGRLDERNFIQQENEEEEE